MPADIEKISINNLIKKGLRMTILPISIFDNDLQRGDIIKFNYDELMVCDERCFWTENSCLLNLKDTRYFELSDEMLSSKAGFVVDKEQLIRNLANFGINASPREVFICSDNYLSSDELGDCDETIPGFRLTKPRDKFGRNRRIKRSLMKKFSIPLLKFRGKIEVGDIIECRKSGYPYEKNVSFIVVKAKDDDGVNFIKLVVISGYKAGLWVLPFLFKTDKNIVEADWLIKNWKYIFYRCCDIRHTYVNLQNRKEILNFTDKQLENFIKIKRKRLKFKWKK